MYRFTIRDVLWLTVGLRKGDILLFPLQWIALQPRRALSSKNGLTNFVKNNCKPLPHTVLRRQKMKHLST